ncbi:MAG: hypothetical protein ACYCXW_14130, partial [Solirubrobacteraceae bacterium]
PGVPAMSAHGDRVSYRLQGLSEWFAAGPLGIEQGFTVQRRPSGGGPLSLALDIGGALRAQLAGGSVRFDDAMGVPELRYGGLVAVDASGRRLPATMTLVAGRLVVRVMDAGARYPITIDPFIQQGSKLVADCTSSCANQGSGENGAGNFGYSVALSADGRTAIVGAWGDSNDVGAAWVFSDWSGTWTQQAQLTGAGESGMGEFGFSVALSADGRTAIVGGPGDSNNAGAAWVFAQWGGTWTQETELVGDCTSGCVNQGTGEIGSGEFGYSVALSADGMTALVGGPGDYGNTGAAWVFDRWAGGWTQQGAKLVADCVTNCANEGTGENGQGAFGTRVALDSAGSLALVGAPGDSSDAGAAWVFARSESFSQRQPDGWSAGQPNGWNTGQPNGWNTGQSIVWSPGQSIVWSPGQSNGATPQHSNGSSPGRSRGWGLEHSNGWGFGHWTETWSQQAELTAGGETGAGQLGFAVALSADGSTALVGAPFDSADTGSAWVFSHSDGAWSQSAELTGSGAAGPAYFGGSVALDGAGSTALVGGFGDSGFVGAAWAFGLSGGSWSQQGATLVGDCTSNCATQGTGEVGPGAFGVGVALSSWGNTALVGAPFDSNDLGAAWTFVAPWHWATPPGAGRGE